MAFNSTDLANIETAIINLATGAHEVEVMIRNKKVRYAEVDLSKLQQLRAIIQAELGTTYTRTYAKNAGRAGC